MNTNKKTMILIGLAAFLLLALIYYYAIYPKSEEKGRVAHSIEQLKTDISLLETHLNDVEEIETPEEDYELRKKLPAERELDTLLHAIHGVELSSSAQILSITFNHYDGDVVSESDFFQEEDDIEAAPEEDAENEEDPDNEEVIVETEEEAPITEIDLNRLPKQLQLMTLEVEMTVADEEHLLTFIKEIESLERIVRIDRVDITQPGEEQLTLQIPEEEVLVTVQLTAFYSEEAELEPAEA